MQYFLGYSSYSPEPPFDPSLFVEIRKRMGDELIAEMNARVLAYSSPVPVRDMNGDGADDDGDGPHKGELLIDATACLQDIAYPIDLNLLNDARLKSESIIDLLHKKLPEGKKPRTYRKKARKDYLKVAQNRNPGRKTIRKGIKSQLQYLRRNLKTIEGQLDRFKIFPLPHKWQRYYWIIQTLYLQQKEMFDNRSRSVEDRIVSIHQPHVRPIVRGKARNKTEFGAKIHLLLVDGYAFLDTISWDAYHEGCHLADYVENYRKRFGFYPAKVLADKLYCSRENRKWLKSKGIKLSAKLLGRPSARAVEDHVRPGERNPIEGKFGQAKNGYGMDRIRARLRNTSQSWIASIILVLNLVRLAGRALLCRSFSAWNALGMTIIDRENSFLDDLVDKNRPERNFRPVLIPCSC
ncbi:MULTISPECIES: transposase [Echinicola]|nr:MULTISPECIES: transposase [Echinicola]